MRGVNRTIIAGNLARDPDVRYTVNKKVYARFSVAVNYRYKNINGEYQDGVDYVPIVVWGAQAENCGKYLRKGSAILIEGRVQTSSYEAKDGSGKRYSTEVNADNVVFLGSGQQGTGSGGGYPRGEAMPFDEIPQPYVPTDYDFGRSIGERGFNGEFIPNFGDSGVPNNGNGGVKTGDDMPENDLPF